MVEKKKIKSKKIPDAQRKSEVGYKKPPKEHQFKPGKSSNPNGAPALPYIIDKIDQGDTELIPVITELTDGKVQKNATQSDCLNWWQENKEQWLIPFEKESFSKDPNESK